MSNSFVDVELVASMGSHEFCVDLLAQDIQLEL